jgi:hypothetical protein
MSAMETESVESINQQMQQMEIKLEQAKKKEQEKRDAAEMKRLMNNNASIKELEQWVEKKKEVLQQKEKQEQEERVRKLNNPAIDHPDTEVKRVVDAFTNSFNDVGCYFQSIIRDVNEFKKEVKETVQVTVPVEVEVEVPVSTFGLVSLLNRNKTEKKVEIKQVTREEERTINVLLDDTDQVPVTKKQLLSVHESGLAKVVELYQSAYLALLKLDVAGSLQVEIATLKKSLEYYKSQSDSQHDMKRKKAESRGCECEKGFCTRNSKCKCTNGNKIGYCGRNCKCSHGQSFIDLEDEVEGVCLNNKEAQTLLEKEYKKIVEDQVLTPDLEASAKKEAQRKVVLHYKPNYYKDNNAIPQQQA